MKRELTGQIAFASGKIGDYDIWTLDVASGELNQITSGCHWNEKPAWSPDGRWIAFVSNRTEFQEIYKAPAAGGEPTQVTHLNCWCDSPRFSPDGSQIAYMSNESGNSDIWIMDADGQNRRQITEHEGSDTFVDWTPDGNGLLWSSDRDENDADIWYWNLQTGQHTQLTTERGADLNPVASPCGQLIAFVSDRQAKPDPKKPFADRDKDIWLMAADGSFPVRLTENQGCDFCACWSPDGKHILYASNNDRSDCHLRVIDVSEMVDAFNSRDEQAIQKVADDIRSEAVPLNREQLQSEIGAIRHTTFLTCLLPQKWVESCYPPGYFGNERWPHWVNGQQAASLDEVNSIQETQIS